MSLEIWLNRADERDTTHSPMRVGTAGPTSQLWVTHIDSALQGGLLGLEQGEAETNREQFSEEVLIEGVRNCFTSGYGSEIRRTRQV